MYKNILDVSRENRFSLCHITKNHIANINSSKSFLCETVLSALLLPFYVLLDCFFLLSSFLFSGLEVKLRLKFYKSFSPPVSARKTVNCGFRMAELGQSEERKIHINVIPIWGFRLFRSLFLALFIFLRGKYFATISFSFSRALPSSR